MSWSAGADLEESWLLELAIGVGHQSWSSELAIRELASRSTSQSVPLSEVGGVGQAVCLAELVGGVGQPVCLAELVGGVGHHSWPASPPRKVGRWSWSSELVIGELVIGIGHRRVGQSVRLVVLVGRVGHRRVGRLGRLVELVGRVGHLRVD